MNYSLAFKGTMMGLVLSACAVTVNAQKIEEQDLKVNVDKIANPVTHLKNLEPVTYKFDTTRYKHLKLPSGEQYGFLTKSVQPEFPAMVYEASKMYTAGKNATKVARYDEVSKEDLIPVLVAAIKEQQAEIDLLKKELNLLKERRSE